MGALLVAATFLACFLGVRGQDADTCTCSIDGYDSEECHCVNGNSNLCSCGSFSLGGLVLLIIITVCIFVYIGVRFYCQRIGPHDCPETMMVHGHYPHMGQYNMSPMHHTPLGAHQLGHYPMYGSPAGHQGVAIGLPVYPVPGPVLMTAHIRGSEPAAQGVTPEDNANVSSSQAPGLLLPAEGQRQQQGQGGEGPASPEPGDHKGDEGAAALQGAVPPGSAAAGSAPSTTAEGVCIGAPATAAAAAAAASATAVPSGSQAHADEHPLLSHAGHSSSSSNMGGTSSATAPAPPQGGQVAAGSTRGAAGHEQAGPGAGSGRGQALQEQEQDSEQQTLLPTLAGRSGP
mmetsp:Transcript_4317/g.9354  ORF Transcript_4317/g.9354 Transcript_4317/m.9354 type:complete len:345 (+) Transcript_4317:149-1183(+)|eukprot:CAMPEP_0202922662 /NCGR_PEP_ID=MMETSP1392-20130828/78040_1 /ASSEMBLY_ACC=CAM_ASM_000868 /TAXON_ID=225041 /ORGANISM="Chlamydomonas chlamydogama, Strain SAG 11-48b" /LENGTH=344 /DNA_ID=CAMNT_0049616301 /DNA_START=135 /DNA_END=1169 /DNA_ORIENTATION=-